MAITTEMRASVLELYTAYFNRAADTAGVDYWTNELDVNGWSILDVASSFADQQEYAALYSGLTNTEITQAIYQNILGRDTDPAGLAYWVAELDSGTMAVQNLITAVINAATEVDSEGNAVHPDDKAIVDNKTAVSQYYYDHGLNEVDVSLADVTKDPDTITIATDAADMIIDKVTAIEEALSNYSNTNFSLGTLSNLTFPGVDTLASGIYWSGDLSTITYSFNETIPSSYYDYFSGSELTQGFTPLNEAQRDAVRSITEEINDLLGITFQEVPADGNIQFNIVDSYLNDNSFAFYPGTYYDYEGDVFLSDLYNIDDNYGLNPGDYGWYVIAHELGHAMGLLHPFEGETTLPSDLDNHLHTIMSYTYINNFKPDFTYDSNDSSIEVEYIMVLPSLYSLYDIAALQAIYGVNTSTNITDDVYTFTYTDFMYETIWDAGGVDTFDLSENMGNTVLDLRGGSLNSIDEYTLEDIVKHYQTEINIPYYNEWIESVVEDLFMDDSLYTGHDNISIAHGTIIENVMTGSGNDIITDNEVDNIINTSFGDDSIYVGNGGYDIVNGGSGTDTLYLDLLVSDVTLETYAGGYLMYSDNYAVTFEDIEYIAFQDDSMYRPDDLFG